MSNNREKAKRLMKHYLRTIAGYSGMKWTADNDAEAEDLVDCLVDAAKEELKEELFSVSSEFFQSKFER